jgi:hypothetical protein
MGEMRSANRVLVETPQGKTPLGTHGRRWEDNIKMDLQERHLEAWTRFLLYTYTRILVEEPEVKRPLGRHRGRWEDNIKMDLQEAIFGGTDWIFIIYMFICMYSKNIYIYIYIRIFVGKPEEKKPLGRHRGRWEDNIKMDLQEAIFGSTDRIYIYVYMYV